MRTFNVDLDELCWLWLEELVKKYGSYMKIEEIYCLILGKCKTRVNLNFFEK